jgi:hypothetical protein
MKKRLICPFQPYNPIHILYCKKKGVINEWRHNYLGWL